MTDLSIDFRVGGDSARFEMSGFSEPEKIGTWMIGDASTLIIPVSTSARRSGGSRRFDLCCDVSPMLITGSVATQRVQLTANDSVLIDSDLNGPMALRCTLTEDHISENGTIGLTFRHTGGIRPADYGGGDTRVLSICLLGLRITERYSSADSDTGGCPFTLGDELLVKASLVEKPFFSQSGLAKEVVYQGEVANSYLPLLPGTERFAPAWLRNRHLKPQIHSVHDLSCFFSEDVSVSGIGYVFVEGKLLTSAEFMPNYWRATAVSDSWAGLRRDCELPQTKIDEETIVCCGWGIDVYGHFLIEMLPRLWLARKAIGNQIGGYKLLMSRLAPNWLRRIVTQQLGFSDKQIVTYSPREEQVRLHHAALPTLSGSDVGFHPALNDMVGSLLHGTKDSNNLRISRLYVSRAGFFNPSTPNRKCENELELERIAETEFEFTVIHPEQLSWPIQINLFHSADIIVGEVGSGLHNAIFTKSGAKIGALGFNNLTQSSIGALRGHHNAYLAVADSGEETYLVDPEMFRDFMRALVRD